MDNIKRVLFLTILRYVKNRTLFTSQVAGMGFAIDNSEHFHVDTCFVLCTHDAGNKKQPVGKGATFVNASRIRPQGLRFGHIRCEYADKINYEVIRRWAE